MGGPVARIEPGCTFPVSWYTCPGLRGGRQLRRRAGLAGGREARVDERRSQQHGAAQRDHETELALAGGVHGSIMATLRTCVRARSSEKPLRKFCVVLSKTVLMHLATQISRRARRGDRAPGPRGPQSLGAPPRPAHPGTGGSGPVPVPVRIQLQGGGHHLRRLSPLRHRARPGSPPAPSVARLSPWRSANACTSRGSLPSHCAWDARQAVESAMRPDPPTQPPLTFDGKLRAGEGNRTPISGLGSPRLNHWTTPATGRQDTGPPLPLRACASGPPGP